MWHRIQRARLRLALAVVLPLLAPPLAAQGSARFTGSDCGITLGAPCTLRAITEVTTGMAVLNSVGDQFTKRVHLAASVGLVAPVAPRLGLGAVAMLGFRNGNPYVLVGPRLRYHATPSLALDITPGIQLKRPAAADGQWVAEVSLMHRDRVGINVQAASSVRYDYTVDPYQTLRSTSLYAGLRLGSKPGRVGVLGGAAAFFVASIICLATNCVGD